MAVTNYYTVNGAIIGEKTAGGSRTDYLTDALGSVTATINQSGQVVNTYRYKPYGAQLAKTGLGADPAFQWVGSQGYRQTSKKYSDVYVRARHYDSRGGRWASMDPLRYSIGRVNLYGYVDGRPTLDRDPSGLYRAAGGCCCPVQPITITALCVIDITTTTQLYAGHVIEVDYTLEWGISPDFVFHDCKMRWMERNPEPSTCPPPSKQPIPPNQWND